MECYTWWLTIALCFSALAASKGDENTKPPLIPFDPQDPPTFTMFAQDPPPITMFDDEEVEDVDHDDVLEDDMELESRDFMDTNPTKVNGQPLFEGDILLSEDQWRAIKERKGLTFQSYRWPEGADGFPLVPYRFTDSRLNQNAIKAGMQHWMDHTCIKFEETTNTNQRHLKYIYGGGCYSYIGMQRKDGQDISIESGCSSLGVVAHEVGHAMGFFHEQSRPDRDDYVVINLENIQDNREGNFNKYGTNYIDTENIPYDYSSDMHYGPTGFTINGKTCIATKDPLTQGLIGQRAGLSHRDIHLANIMYKCIDKWLAKCEVSTDPCQNGGYYGALCNCICPPGTSGTNCETQTGGYYDALLNSCNEKVTEEGTLTSPNYPNNYPNGPGGQCVKLIQAPECHVPKVTFSNFRMASSTNCYYEALEIRTNDNMNFGDVFCGTTITTGRSFTSTSRDMILYFRARTNQAYKGWSAELTFEKQGGCDESGTTTTTTTTSTTTTTTTEKSTTTEEITTTEGSSPECTLEYSNGRYYWSSPNFGDGEYPNSFTCGVRANAAAGTYSLYMVLHTFDIQGGQDGVCADNLKIEMEGDKTMTFCGMKGGTVITSPSFNFNMRFTADETIAGRGFKIVIRPIRIRS